MMMLIAPPFALCGEIDLANADEVRAELSIGLGLSIGEEVLDCSSLRFMDCSGLAVLVEHRDALAGRGRALRLHGLRGTPRLVVELAGLAEYLGVE